MPKNHVPEETKIWTHVFHFISIIFTGKCTIYSNPFGFWKPFGLLKRFEIDIFCTEMLSNLL